MMIVHWISGFFCAAADHCYSVVYACLLYLTLVLSCTPYSDFNLRLFEVSEYSVASSLLTCCSVAIVLPALGAVLKFWVLGKG
jgi:hypothetical protein